MEMSEKDFNNMVNEFSTIVKKYKGFEENTITINELLGDREASLDRTHELYEIIKDNEKEIIEREKEIIEIKLEIKLIKLDTEEIYAEIELEEEEIKFIEEEIAEIGR